MSLNKLMVKPKESEYLHDIVKANLSDIDMI